MNILLCLLIVVLFTYAFIFQKNEYRDPFKNAKVKNTTTPKRALRYIKVCLASPQRAVKWRTIFIATILSIIVIFTVIHARTPSNSEAVMHFVIIYIVFYCMTEFIDSTVHQGAYLTGLRNLEVLRKNLN